MSAVVPPVLDIAARRPHRADARRNFDALLVAARDAFAKHGTNASLEDIARHANVGIGTLYRHFPTRQALLEAVYVGEIEELCAAARDVADLPPWEAFTTWLDRFAAYVATKLALLQALNKDSEMFRACRTAIHAAAQPLFDRAQESGALRPDAGLDDVLRMVSGIVASVYVDDEQRARVIGIALDGLRARE
jgi:AcrR family transcriptional regulator